MSSSSERGSLFNGSSDPTAIEGTWSDVERRARYLYKLDTATVDEREMAEAVLVLLGQTKELTYERDVLRRHGGDWIVEGAHRTIETYRAQVSTLDALVISLREEVADLKKRLGYPEFAR